MTKLRLFRIVLNLLLPGILNTPLIVHVMAQEHIQISGLITDAASSKPVDGVSILVQGTSVDTVSDMNGTFTLSIPQGDVTLVFSHTGYKTQEITTAGTTSVNVSLVADTADTFAKTPAMADTGNQIPISGSVIDSGTTTPIAGATILVQGTSVDTVSDMNGIFTLSIPQGDVTLVFSHTGYKTREITVAGRTSFNVSLATEATDSIVSQPEVPDTSQQVSISGVITDGNTNKPVFGVDVLIKGTTVGKISDMNGQYAVNAPRSDVTLVFSSAGYRTQEVTSDGKTTVNVSLLPESTPAAESAVEDSGQQVKISGSIIDGGTNEPLGGVMISIKGTATQSISNMNGQFTMDAPKGNVMLVFSRTGYTTREVSANGNNVINVSLMADAMNLGTEVVVGYGTQSKRSVSGSITSASADDIRERSFSNVLQSLSGKLPGVNITQSQGAPGSSPIIKIRGSSSITAGTTPLYVIDGLPMENFNLNMINPQDIASIDVLKDASSAAIYGSRGANGVVIVTTKLGKAGKTSINATYEHSIQQVAKFVDMMNAQQFIDYYIDAKNNAWVDNGGNRDDDNDTRPGTTYDIPVDFTEDPEKLGLGTNWQDVVFRTAPADNLQISMTGGTEKTQYLMSMGYLDQKAVIDNNYYKRLTLRTNLKQTITDKVTLGGNLAFTGIYDRTDGTNGKVDVVSLALQNTPIFPIYNENGNLGFKDPNSKWNRFAAYTDLQLWHPYSMTREIDKQNKNFNTMGTAFLEYAIIDGLDFRSSASGNLYNIRFNSFRNTNQKYGYSTANPAEANESSSFMLNWLTENTLSYDKSLENHRFKALLGYTAQKQRDEYTLVRSTGFPSDLVHTLNAGTVNYGTSSASEWSMLSYLARVNYSLLDKYFLTGAIRRDGSSRFGKNNRWGYFPSVSAAWLISQEDFLSNIDKISNLKLKTSYGLTGNNQIPNYGAISLLGASNYVFGSSVSNGQRVINIANPDLKWEKTAQFNAGIELGIFDDRFNLTAEFYNSTTKDLLLFLPVPDITGFSTQLTNIGRLRNRGFEIGFTSHNLTGDLQWTTDLNYSMNRNKVLELGPKNAPIIFSEWDVSVKTEVGQPISNYWGYRFDGVYADEDALANSPHLASAKPGDPIIRDVNGDGQISDKDKTILGNIQPDFIMSLTNTISFKGIELSFMLQGSYGGEIANQQWRYCGVWNSGRNLYADVYNYWRSPSDPGDGVHFRPTINKVAFQGQFSNLWVEDGSFLRVKNIRLSYTLPKKLVSRGRIQSTKIYVNVENAFLFTNYSGFDPENTSYNATTYSATGRGDPNTSGTSVGVSDTYNSITSSSTLPTGAMLGVDIGSYPVPRIISFGINVEF